MCCLELLCCCFGPAACGLCCKGLPEAKSSYTTRILYVTFLMLVVIVSAILLAPDISDAVVNSFLCQLQIDAPTVRTEIPVVNRNVSTPTFNIITYDVSDVCRDVFGYTSVYRICMGVACFFFVLMLMMICVVSSKDPRSYIQNGFWCIKFLVVIGIIVGFFFIPRSNFIFSTLSVVIGFIGAFIFILLQVIFLVDFAHTWAESWLEKQKESENILWVVGLLIFTIIFYLISLIGVILMFIFFVTSGGCELNIFFLCFIVVLSIGVSIVAILPPIQRAQSTSGLLQPSIVTLYTVYLTYSALSNEPYGPDTNCNLGTVINNITGTVNNTDTTVSVSSVTNIFNGTNEIIVSVIGIVIMFITVGYTSIYLSNNKQLQKLRGNHKGEDEGYSVLCGDCCCLDASEAAEVDAKDDTDEVDEDKKIRVVDDEKEHVTYSYSFFHFMMLISTLFVMMQLTNWYNPSVAGSESFQNTWASVWIKMASAWLCYVIYLWTLLAPLILSNRDFGYETE